MKSLPTHFLLMNSLMLCLVSLLLGTTACQTASSESTKSSLENTSFTQSPMCTQTQLSQNLLQAVIDLPKLQQYYPVEEVKERGTLVLLRSENLNPQPQLTKFDQLVEVLNQEEIRTREISAYLVIEEMNMGEVEAKVELTYATQGIHLLAVFERMADCQWQEKSSRLVER